MSRNRARGRPCGVDHGVEGVDPFGGLLGIDVRELVRHSVEEHVSLFATRLAAAHRFLRRPRLLAPRACMLGRHGAEGETVVYTDGSCLGNPGPGGWAWAVPTAPSPAGPRPIRPTSAWRSPPCCGPSRPLTGPLLVISDSTYVVNCFRDRWWEGWKRRGWRTRAGQAGGQPGPVGAAARPGARSGPAGPLQLGERPLGRRDERPGRPARHRGGGGPAGRCRESVFPTDGSGLRRVPGWRRRRP